MVPKSTAARAENRHLETPAPTSEPVQPGLRDAAHDLAGSAVVAASPARQLQLELEKSWAPAAPETRWSARRSLAFILLTNGLLWTALIWGVAKVV